MSHQIKIARANRLSPMLPMASQEIWNSIPRELITQLTSKQLAIVVNTLDHHWRKAQAKKEAEVISDGCIWSFKHDALLGINYPEQNNVKTQIN